VVEALASDLARAKKRRTVVGVIAKNPFYRKKILSESYRAARSLAVTSSDRTGFLAMTPTTVRRFFGPCQIAR